MGTLLILGKGLEQERYSRLGVALSLCSAVTWALYIVWADKMEMGSMSLPQLQLFVNGCSCLMTELIYGLLSGTLLVQLSSLGWEAVVGTSAFIGVFGTAFFTFGVRYSKRIGSGHRQHAGAPHQSDSGNNFPKRANYLSDSCWGLFSF